MMTSRVLGVVAVAGAAVFLATTLAGCASTSANCTDITKGICTVNSMRLLTDSVVGLETPQGVHLTFSSKPNEAGTAAAIKQLGDVINLLGTLVKGPAVVPGAFIDQNGVAHSNELTGP